MIAVIFYIRALPELVIKSKEKIILCSRKIAVTKYFLPYRDNNSLISGLNNLSKFLHILKNHLVLLKVRLENQAPCTWIIILK